MSVAGLILGCMMFAQLPNDPLPPLNEPARKEPASLQTTAPPDTFAPTGSTTPEISRGQRRPPELVEEAIRLPADAQLEGRPYTLLEALGSTTDRNRQLQIVRAYWRLFGTTAEYNYTLEYSRQIAPTAIGGEGAALLAARAEASARLQAAKLDAVRAQYELAAWCRMAADAPPPLPTDPPHVGAYRTYFDQLFAGRSAPEPVVLAAKILPLQREAIDQSAAAVLAAEDAVEAVVDDYRGGRVDAAAVVACNRDLLKQRKSFIRLANDYNHAIADYGLTVVSPTAGARQLTAALIGPTRIASNPRANNNSIGEPTPAKRPDGWRPNEPTLAPPPDSTEQPNNNQPGDNQPTLAPRYQPRYGDPNTPTGSLERIEPGTESPTSTEHVTRKPDMSPSLSAATALYPALQNAPPQTQANQLNATIHWDRYLPKDAGKPMGLKEALLRNSGGDRSTTIDAYWLLRRRAAEYQILAERIEFYETLLPVVLERRNTPTGPADMLRLNAALLAARAELTQAQTALVEAQFNLALLVGATAEPQWPLASTVPHSGDYLLKLDAQPEALRNNWSVRRLAAMIPGQSENVRQRAAAVIESEKARVESAENYRSGRAAIGRVLDSISSQTEQTEAFLDSLQRYNRSITEYVLTVLPATTPVDKLIVSLIVEQ